jgi:HEAT repeat protein
MTRCRRPGIFLIAALGASVTLSAQQKNSAVELLTGQLRTSDLQVRAQAAFRLLELGRGAEEAYPELVQTLADDEALDYLVAAQALYARPRPAGDAPSLAQGLKFGTKARVAAAWELSRIGPSAGVGITRSLIEALPYPDKHERNVVVLALAATSLPARNTVPALVAVLRDAGSADSQQTNYRYPRAAAAVALGMIGPHAHEGVSALKDILADGDGWEYQRAAAGWALARISPGTSDARHAETVGKDSVPALAHTLAKGPERINLRVIEGLRTLGEFAGAARPILKKGTSRRAPAVHESIALAIGYLDSLAQPPAPAEIARQETEGNFSEGVVRYLMALGGIQQGITPVLLESLARGEQDPRVLAARRLGALGPAAREAIPVLRAATADPDWIVRREAILALRRVEAPASVAPPSAHVYKTLGERKLQLAMHYPPGWKQGDRWTAVLFFSGAHRVLPDENGKLPPLAAERAKLGLPVVNTGLGKNHAPFCDALAQRGLVCLRVEYRTRGKDGVLPGEDIADAVDAIRWVRGHAGLLGIDPDRVVAAGGSSGAYLAASLFAFEHRYPADGDRPVSARPNAIMLYSPLVDWLEVGSMSMNFLVVLGGDKELGARISPARHWRSDSPPTLVMVGTEEPPFATVRQFAENWRAAGAPIDLYVAQDAQHGFFAQPAWMDKTLVRTDQFLRSLGYAK